MYIPNVAQRTYQSTANLDGVYNVGAYWPKEVENAVQHHFDTHKYLVQPSQHCYNRCDEYGIEYSSIASALMGEVIEAYFDNGRLWKVVTRQPSKDKKGSDICCAVKLQVYGALCVTVWLNNQSDRHDTLRYMNYEYQKKEVKTSTIRETPAAVFTRRRVFSNAL